MPSIAVALGSNLGDRAGHLEFAVARLQDFVSHLRVSGFHETNPVGVGAQPRFLNAVATGDTTLSARQVLNRLLTIEQERGRERPFAGAPRTLDLDLVFFGNELIEEPGLSVPHPRFRERAFVLEPLSEIAADWVDPVTGRTVGELWEEIRPDGSRDRGPEGPRYI
jgi:2-amino-4-hydroxy-6-hydroxymethyldihydropteridine diphosphokinase